MQSSLAGLGVPPRVFEPITYQVQECDGLVPMFTQALSSLSGVPDFLQTRVSGLYELFCTRNCQSYVARFHAGSIPG